MENSPNDVINFYNSINGIFVVLCFIIGLITRLFSNSKKFIFNSSHEIKK
jgi:hypothetical protein